MSQFQILVSADAVVPDLDAAVAACVREWGLLDPDPSWVQAPAGYGGRWVFARVHSDRRLAPTPLEILEIPYRAPAPAERPFGYPYLPEIAAEQGDRPVRNHSTVVGADVDGVAARMAARGAEFRLDPPNEILPFPRLWVGFTPERPDRYDPAGDAGLRIEVVPYEALRLPAPTEPPAERHGDGRPVRIGARTLFVADLDEALRTLEANFAFTPAGPVTAGEDGVRRARFAFPHGNGADLEVLEAGPGAGGPEAEFFQKWGPGPWSIRIEVDGLEALARRLEDGGVPHLRLAPAAPGGGERILRPAERELGAAFEFVEAPGSGTSR